MGAIQAYVSQEKFNRPQLKGLQMFARRLDNAKNTTELWNAYEAFKGFCSGAMWCDVLTVSESREIMNIAIDFLFTMEKEFTA